MATYLVDFENVRSDDLFGVSRLGEQDRVILFYSEKADKISIGLHRRILECKAAFEYRKAEVGAKDALDFQLVTYLGFLIAERGTERYVVVSNDQGFEYAASFWRRQKFDVRLMSSIVPLDPPVRPQPQPEKVSEPAVNAPAPDKEAEHTEENGVITAAAEPVPASDAPATQEKEISPEPAADAPAKPAMEALPAPAAPVLLPEPVIEEEEQSSGTAPKPYRSRDGRKPTRSRTAPKSRPSSSASSQTPAKTQAATAEEKTAKDDCTVKKSVANVLGPNADAEKVAEYILRYKSKLGINNALVKEYGSQKGGELYQKIKSLIADKKGH